ncbi:hypothetical protein I8J29_09130 [Paenibacillus sp. MWE-103]|uniref:Copper amine oxidase-like N-terminal domain-containing protein n=1 Tax=Paenibacillus artemisiicola TaxID=1172618 RepID=A0ABS3W899_9BACL|nr:hypothetical protein [Paenibacillus artemisiicola]MBO7744355.1 hypothetical protein [Paenibacillus artemisiicola]
MRVKIGIVVVFLSMVCAHFATASPDRFEQRAQEKFEADRPTEVTVNYNKTNTEKTYKDNWIPVRFLFGRTSDQITWDNNTKTAAIVRNGEKLLFCLKDVTGSKDEVVWPKQWFRLRDGRTFLDIIYLNQIFDRYGNYEAGSEERAWAQKLSFLGISYIDSQYGGKDSIEHVFIMVK